MMKMVQWWRWRGWERWRELWCQKHKVESTECSHWGWWLGRSVLQKWCEPRYSQYWLHSATAPAAAHNTIHNNFDQIDWPIGRTGVLGFKPLGSSVQTLLSQTKVWYFAQKLEPVNTQKMLKPFFTPIIEMCHIKCLNCLLLTILAHLIYLMFILNQAPNPLETD